MEEYQTIIPAEKPIVKTKTNNLTPQISEICDDTKCKRLFVDVDTNVDKWLRAHSVPMHTGN
jgi:hypothetical protein